MIRKAWIPPLAASLIVALGVGGGASAETQGAGAYGPYAFLVGEWDVASAGGAPFGIARFRWGPKQSYLWYSVSTFDQGEEQPHFEGLLVWNGVRRNLDVLLVMDMNGGRAQEQGAMSILPDGTVVRDIVATYSEGAKGTTARFRQTFKAAGPDTIVTNAMRETKDGWAPTFPGSDRLVMSRRAKPPKAG